MKYDYQNLDILVLLPCPMKAGFGRLANQIVMQFSEETGIHVNFLPVSAMDPEIQRDLMSIERAEEFPSVTILPGFGIPYTETFKRRFRDTECFTSILKPDNEIFRRFGFYDPKGVYDIIGVAPIAFFADRTYHPELTPPKSWHDLLTDPQYHGMVGMPGRETAGFQAFPIMAAYHLFGEEGVLALAKTARCCLLPAEMVRMAGSRRDLAPAVGILNLSMARAAAQKSRMTEFIWLEEGLYRLMVNMEKLTGFQDAEVRGALYQALDRQAMVDSVFQGLGHIASAGYVPQTNPYYCEDVKTYDYDPDYAKSVLEPLGLSLRLVAGQDTPAEATLAELIKMNLEAVGITVTVESYDVATRDSMAATGDYDLLLTYHGGWNAEPLSMLRAIYGATPDSGSKWASFSYSNDELQSMLANLPYLLNLDERSAAYDDVQILISEEIPNLPLITQVSYAMYRPDVYDCWKASFNSTQFSNSRLSYTSDTDV